MPNLNEAQLYQRLRGQLAGKLRMWRIETDTALGVGDVWYVSAPTTRTMSGWMELKAASYNPARGQIKLEHMVTAPQAEFLSLAYLAGSQAALVIGVAHENKWWRYLVIKDPVVIRWMVGSKSFGMADLMGSTCEMPGHCIAPEETPLIAALRPFVGSY